MIHTIETRALEAAKRGAAELDLLDPRWFMKIDLDKLNMVKGIDEGDGACVLCQLYGTYSHGMQELGINYEEWNGFNAGSARGFAALDAAWTQLITERRNSEKGMGSQVGRSTQVG